MLQIKRFMGYADLDKVIDLEEQCFPQGGYGGSGVADYGWSVEAYEEIMHDPDLRFYCIWAPVPIEWTSSAGSKILVAATFGFVKHISEQPEFWVQGISVDKAYRRKGLGKMCLTLLEFEAHREGCSKILSDCSTKNWGSIRLHYDMGYDSIGTTQNYYRNGEEALYFRKEI